MKLRKIIFAFASVFLMQNAFSKSVEEIFDSEIYKSKEISIPYRFSHFNESESDKAVLIVFLHGHSACGNDNRKQLTKDSLRNIERYVRKNKINAFVLAPQCKENQQWTKITENLNELISDFKEKNNCSEVFIAGESMGGIGAWLLIDEYPKLSKKTVIIAAPPAKPNIKNLAKNQIFVVYGENDDIGSPSKIEPVIEKIKNADGKIESKKLSGLNHGDTCSQGLSEDVLDWMLK